MYFLLESGFLFFDEEKVLFGVFADSARMNVLVIGQSSLVLASPTAIPTHQPRLGMRSLVGRVGRQRLVFSTADVTLRENESGRGNIEYLPVSFFTQEERAQIIPKKID